MALSEIPVTFLSAALILSPWAEPVYELSFHCLILAVIHYLQLVNGLFNNLNLLMYDI